jgi:hypothetical protein
METAPAAVAGSSTEATKHEAAGLAHVATVSFLASRASPVAGFWIALAGGVALARAAQRDGARLGYGASLAATLQTIALIGPVRISVPLTQALSAPLIGALERRATPVRWQVLACAAVRLAHLTVLGAFGLFVLAGGLDVYTDTYESLTGWTGFMPQGQTAALVLTGAGLLVWTAFASTVQVLVYRRGLLSWPTAALDEGERTPEPPESLAGRFDPRAVALAAAIAFALLIGGLSWVLLGAVAAWLALAAVAGGGDGSVVRTGALLALLLGAGVLAFTLLGGLGSDEAFRRALRAVLLVLVATWLRAAAGANGLREVSRRGLGRLGRVPPAAEAAAVMDELGSGRQLGPAVRSALATLRSAPARPLPVVDAVLGWVVAESRRFRRAAPAPPMGLRVRVRDVVLVVGACACALALFA